ncbi:SEC-C metal-binding domain-containing protein [Propionivibrio sp.]|uniref:SEC-C metal-binding domain-containing protein n=1 Tax=Propionivibrio sp. TaxID=2212460 RepID=UPI003BF3CB08
MQADDIEFSSDGIDEINAILCEGTRIACSTTDFSTALVRFSEAFPTLAPKMNALAESNDADAQRARCYMLFREIWKRVPRPDHGFRPLPLPKQERNEPCQCGSGRKFKQCCARLEGVLPFDPQGLSLLKYVLEDLPTSAYEKLPFDHMSPEELAFVAEQWIEEGNSDEVTFLLVPLLSQVKKLDARHEAAFDILGDAYLQLGMPEQRIQLVERVMEASDPTLRCAAMHRRCTIYSDAGDWSAAWKLFAKAEHLQPDNPSLAHLETIMLASEGRTERAKERALYWLSRLGRQGHVPADDPLMDFLRQMSEDPDAVLAMIRSEVFDDYDEDDEEDFLDDDDFEWMMPLVGMLETLPEPVCHYKLHPAHGDAGGLEADQYLAALEQQWQVVFENDTIDEYDEQNPWENTGWISWLTENPLAWQSFAILDDVAAFIDETPMVNASEDTYVDMEKQLLDHAFSLLEAVISGNKAQGCRLEWGWIENRPALRLLDSYINTLVDLDEELRLLEWLVCTLNPNDNQGLRESLARRLIASDRASDALALCDRYPDDSLGAMPYARVLALHQLGRLEEAATALAVARKQRPKFLGALLNPSTAMPDLDFESVTVGGDDEAWYYRMDWFPLWLQTGALDWLQKVAKF